MKLMVASDIHGSAHWCRELLKAFDREGADRLGSVRKGQFWLQPRLRFLPQDRREAASF